MIEKQQQTTSHYEELISILGASHFSQKIESPFDFIFCASRGINADIIKNFRKHFGIPADKTACMLNISEPTIYRWTKDNVEMKRNYSVKLLEITDLFLYGSRIFGTKENFFKWLELPNNALGGMEPQELIEIPGGIEKVRAVIGRIEHGVFS